MLNRRSSNSSFLQPVQLSKHLAVALAHHDVWNAIPNSPEILAIRLRIWGVTCVISMVKGLPSSVRSRNVGNPFDALIIYENIVWPYMAWWTLRYESEGVGEMTVGFKFCSTSRQLTDGLCLWICGHCDCWLGIFFAFFSYLFLGTLVTSGLGRIFGVWARDFKILHIVWILVIIRYIEYVTADMLQLIYRLRIVSTITAAEIPESIHFFFFLTPQTSLSTIKRISNRSQTLPPQWHNCHTIYLSTLPKVSFFPFVLYFFLAPPSLAYIFVFI